MTYKHSNLKKKAKALLYVGNLWCISEGMFGPLFAVFAERIGGSILEISGAWAVYLVATGIMMLFVGKISDKYVKKEALLLMGYALNTIFTFGYLLVHSSTGLLLLQLGLAAATSLSTSTWDALYAKYTRKSKGGYAWGLAHGQASVLTGMAMLLGGAIANYISFDSLFVFMGAIQMVGTVLLFTTFKESLAASITIKNLPKPLAVNPTMLDLNQK